MKVIDKIEEFIKDIDDRKKISEEILALHEINTKVGGKEYDDFFKEMLKKWKIKSYKDLPKDKQKDFFDTVDKEWTSTIEKDKKLNKKYKKGDDEY